MKSNWSVKKFNKSNIDIFRKVFNLEEHLASILSGRGFDDLRDISKFLNPKLSNLSSPFLMMGMNKAVKRIRKAIENKERIALFADSDVDGLTSLTIFLTLFHKIGIEPYFRYAIEDEEYGLRKAVIDELIEKQIDILITLDCGIRDALEIKYADEKGIDVIVCDHHEQGKSLPAAIIVNPKLWDCGYPFKELAGVGVAFKLCHAILMSYLQSFDKLFLLITGENDKLFMSHIKNGIVEKIKEIDDVNQLNDVRKIIKEDSIIVHYDLKDEELIKAGFDGFEIHNLLNFVNKNDLENGKKDISSFEDLCNIFSINPKVFTNKIEILNLIFSEIVFNNSPKVKEFIHSIIDLVSIGTIADIMPVVDENRTIVYHGINSLKNTTHPGLSMLINKYNNKVDSKKIAWEISPFLNTPGRFGKTDLVAKFFLEKNNRSLITIINEIDTLNDERKRIVAELFDEINKEIEGIGKEKNVVFIKSEKIPEGLCGILANRLTDTIKKPVIIISLWGNKEVVKGSGRTMGDFNFFSCVEPFFSLFDRIGGHPQAFGFTAKLNNLEIIQKKIEAAIGNNVCLENNIVIDLAIPVNIIDFDFIKSLSLFEPYGKKNNACVFLSKDTAVKNFIRFGKNNNHGKYSFHENRAVEAIGWNMADRMEQYSGNGKIDIVYSLENYTYNDFCYPRMLILDIDR